MRGLLPTELTAVLAPSHGCSTPHLYIAFGVLSFDGIATWLTRPAIAGMPSIIRLWRAKLFKLPTDFPSGSVANVPGVLMKPAEQTRGVALKGVAVKVTGAYFMFGLSNNPPDKQRNLELLNERGWIDIPMVYGNNRRAILAVDKGAAGARVFNEVLAAWGQNQPVQPASPPR
jgi:hypothetical protein